MIRVRTMRSRERVEAALTGLMDAADKLRLAHTINTILDKRHLKQAEAARLLGVNQPKVSALKRYKLDGFSVERLMAFLNALGRDVEIVVRKKPRSPAKARTSVVAA